VRSGRSLVGMLGKHCSAFFLLVFSYHHHLLLLPSHPLMSDNRKPTVEELNAAITKAEQEMEDKKRKIVEIRQAAQECKAAEEEEVRKAEEKRRKAEVEEKAKEACKVEEAHQKAEAERKANELREAEEKQKTKDMRKITELRNTEEARKVAATRDLGASMAENKRLHQLAEARKKLNREILEQRDRLEAEERRKADEKEKLKAGNGMMLATPGDVMALNEPRWINAENARRQAEGFKPRAGSSKESSTLTLKPKSSVNLARQVQEEERLRKTGNRGKRGGLAVSTFFDLFQLF
jgi:hypothetical protein